MRPTVLAVALSMLLPAALGLAFLDGRVAVQIALEPPTSGTRSGTTWTDMAPVVRPSARAEHASAYDAESDRIVLFGGFTGQANGETWAYDFDTNSWGQQTPSVSPGGTNLASMAYDAESDRLIMFGGFQVGGRSDETWAYDYNNDTWAMMNPATRPLARTGHAMAYDAESDRVVMFGGNLDFDVFADETWAYDYNTDTWTQMRPFIQPSARGLHAVAYHASSDRVVLFGGSVELGAGEVQFFPETWTYDYDADAWFEMSPARSPLPRAFFGMAYDALSDRVVAFGGILPDSSRGDDTWAYDVDGDNWTRLDPPTRPPARTGHGLVFDAESGYLVLFGGYTAAGRGADTWTYAPGIPDTTDPTIAITYPGAGETLTSTSLTVRGTASDDLLVARVEVSLDGVEWNLAAGTTSWSDNAVLVEGTNTIRARAVDLSGNVANASVTVTVVLLDVYVALAVLAVVAVVGVWLVLRWRRPPRRGGRV